MDVGYTKNSLIDFNKLNYIKSDNILSDHKEYDLFLLNKKEFNNVSLLEFEILKRLNIALVLKEKKEKKYFFRVFKYLQIMLEYINLNKKQKNEILYASLTYDIGKLAIPDNILFKKEKLDNNEYEVVKKHTLIGEQILTSNLCIESDILKMASIAAKYHHESWNGSGYPDGLKGENIPLIARLIAIADLFNALTSDTAYRFKMSLSDAIDIIREEEGVSLDPNLVKHFRNNNLNKDNIIKIYENRFQND